MTRKEERVHCWIILTEREVVLLKARNLPILVALVLVVSSVAYADTIDVSVSPGGFYSVSFNLFPDAAGDIAVVLDWGTLKHSAKIDHKGSMTANGDYEVWEGRKSSAVFGLGYRAGIATPWVAISTQSTRTTKHEMKIKDSDLIKVTTDMTQPLTGVAFGINVEKWMQPWGVSGTLAKVPDGMLLNARIKYKVSAIGTAHVGYIYNTRTGQGLVAGLGLSY